MESDCVSDLNTAASTAPGHYGATDTGQLTMREAKIGAAWNIQGDPARSAFAEEARRLFALSLPLTPNTTASSGALTAMWLGPTSWLLIAGAPLSSTHPLTDYPAKRDALNGADGALFDVSASRVAWSLAGPKATTVLAKGCPLDFHRRAFPVGGCAQSFFGHVNALFRRHDDDIFTLLVARSFSRNVWSELCEAGAQYGYEVLAPVPFGD
jgi:sarcosine oxidase subunit gamma